LYDIAFHGFLLRVYSGSLLKISDEGEVRPSDKRTSK